MSSSSPLAWSLSSNFSTEENPVSVWSYGLKPGYLLNGNFSLFTNPLWDSKGSGVVAWFTEDNKWNADWLGIYYNSKQTSTLLVYGSNMTFTAHGVCMHPGNNDKEFAVVRFTAPVNGTYTISVIFTHVDDNVIQSNTYTGAYVMYNNEILWEEVIFGYVSKSFITNGDGIEVRENDKIDFLLGVGKDGTFHMTDVNVDISAQQSVINSSTPTINSSTPIIPSTPTNVIENNNRKNYLVGGSIGLILGLFIGVESVLRLDFQGGRSSIAILDETNIIIRQISNIDNKYQPRRGENIKLLYDLDKSSEEVLECSKRVSIAWHGNGRKASWWSLVLLVIYNPETETLESVRKYQEIWKVKADIMISPIHKPAFGRVDPNRGLSLKFPRVREDKSIDDVTKSDQNFGNVL
ncbi:3694_t:CDS:2 [Diversispora eburnea]|uniref:3694_t:CDS:1 n=1 Tax=Diversispora eburnea TaxID=1213867 RepID=A0A9N8Z337_9GLOM|nr:3694_t:CDS:2 [Diversispora eburnea]